MPGPASDLPVDRVDVWVIPVDGSRSVADAERWLSPDERARGERFVFDRDRRRFLLGRRALRGILASYLSCEPEAIAFAYGPTGKPRLAAEDCARGLQFNASGSADLAVCAVTCDRSVGIDIEHLRENCDPDLVRYALCESERADFEKIPKDQQPTAFYRAWTRKEAFLKATGSGLSRPLASFAVSVAPGEPPRLVRDDTAPGELARWSFVDFDPAPGWVGTLVLSDDPLTLQRREWND
jgi:4'-phosphopantetheinyl transferase